MRNWYTAFHTNLCIVCSLLFVICSLVCHYGVPYVGKNIWQKWKACRRTFQLDLVHTPHTNAHFACTDNLLFVVFNFSKFKRVCGICSTGQNKKSKSTMWTSTCIFVVELMGSTTVMQWMLLGPYTYSGVNSATTGEWSTHLKYWTCSCLNNTQNIACQFQIFLLIFEYTMGT